MDRNIESYVRRYDFLTPEECEQTLIELETVSWVKHNYYNPFTKTYQTHENDLYISNTDTKMKEVIKARLWEYIKKYILEDYNFSWFSGWNGYTNPRFNKYPVGTEMRIHGDHIQSMFDGERKGIPTLSVLGALNDDYKGGELVMWTDTVMNLKAGQLIIWPSNFLYPHEVKIVTEGTRYSFVSWVW